MFEITNCKCEYASNPLGIGTRTPRLSWIASSPRRGHGPSAYRLVVASTPELLASGDGDLWDTGRVEGTALAQVTYAGTALSSAQRAYWIVQVWDGDGAVTTSEPAWFELALLDESDWEAKWVGFPAGRNGRALYFKSTFEVDRPVSRARAYVAGIGWHEFRMNGHKLGDAVLEPAQTAFDKRVLYVTHDITADIVQGSNVVAALVGHGWYGAPKLLVQLEIEFEDGTRRQVLTGRQTAGNMFWSASDGPIVENSIYDGEVYDARLEKPGWDTSDQLEAPGGTKWWMVHVADGPGGVLVPQVMEPIRVVETRRPVTLTEPRPGVFVFDGGQNLAGWAQLEVEGPRGTTVTLKFSESLYPDGTVNQENLRGAMARDIYILKGEGREVWEPALTYHGFRFVQVEGFPGTPTLDSLGIRMVRSDVARTGDFNSSVPLLDRIHDAVIWTEMSNLHGVPTDCPQRDERMGWLNDMAARSEELVHNFDVARFLPKWMDDIADAQDERTGAISCTAPFRYGSRPADPVSVCYLLIPWLLYRHYGDTDTMTRHFDGMRRWVDYLTSRAPGHIVEYSYYGDWAPPIDQGLADSLGSSAVAKNTPGTLISTAHYYYAAVLLARMARTIGRSAEAASYEGLAATIHAAFNAAFWDEAKGGYGTANQACQSIALHMDLVPPERRRRVFNAMVADIEDQGFHLTTGNLCTKYILEVLADEGRLDVALKVATQTSYPSWGYMFERGATTMWERWEEATGGGMNSHNHPMYASIGAWLHRRLAGIRLDDAAVAASAFIVAPPLLKGLDTAASELTTVRGKAAASWSRKNGGLALDVEIPAGASALVHVPKPWTGSRLTESNVGLASGSRAAGIESVEETSNGFDVRVGSGSFHFYVAAP